jgi:hypothetical protein
MKSITIKIRPDGAVKIEAEGFTDASCKDATRAIEEGLSGGTTVGYEDKPEACIPATGGATTTGY